MTAKIKTTRYYEPPHGRTHHHLERILAKTKPNQTKSKQPRNLTRFLYLNTKSEEIKGPEKHVQWHHGDANAEKLQRTIWFLQKINCKEKKKEGEGKLYWLKETWHIHHSIVRIGSWFKHTFRHIYFCMYLMWTCVTFKIITTVTTTKNTGKMLTF